MKLNQKAIALCALVALPIGVLTAESTTDTTPASETAKANTHKVFLEVTGMK